jgi:long-chain fatty acid transport protein
MQFNTPSVTTLSLSHRFTPRLTLLADIEHSGWSAFSENRVVHENGPTAVVERGWQDTMGYSLGVNYQASERAMLKFGVGYDESPIAGNQLKIDPPIDRQIAYSLGLETQLTQKIGLSLGYQYLDMGDVRVEQMLFPGQVIRGHSDASVQAIQAAITFDFD